MSIISAGVWLLLNELFCYVYMVWISLYSASVQRFCNDLVIHDARYSFMSGKEKALFFTYVFIHVSKSQILFGETLLRTICLYVSSICHLLSHFCAYLLYNMMPGVAQVDESWKEDSS